MEDKKQSFVRYFKMLSKQGLGTNNAPFVSVKQSIQTQQAARSENLFAFLFSFA